MTETISASQTASSVPADAIDPVYDLLIDGQWVPSSDGARLTSYNPSTGKPLAEFAAATHADVDRAVAAAHRALDPWRHVNVATRAKYLLDIADRLEEEADHIALVETLDNGKPLRETRGVDVAFSIDHFRYFAGVIRGEEDTAKFIDDNTLSLAIREPIGVVGQIVPWNFPLLMAAWKLAPVIAAGDTVVIHPSSSTSLSLLELGKILAEVLPAGVVNIITGRGSDSGQYMLDHDGFDKLAFTGSTEVGYKVAEAAAKRLIPATLELGGKSANIFFDDVDFDRAIEGVQLGILFNQGQVCCAGSRIFVQEGIYDRFIAALQEAFPKVKVGLPWEDGVQMGAQVNERQLEKILDYVKIGQDEGATLLTGGHRITEGPLAQGAFMEPTLLTDVKNTDRCAREEIFGPVGVVIKFKDEADVIAQANESEYGLGGAVWTRDINRAMRVARGVQTGRMWVNTYNQIGAGAPFGGYKKSGIGRETHKDILNAYTQTKNIYINLAEGGFGLY